MEFDNDADHCVNASAVVANADVGLVVATINHHGVVFVSPADVGDVLSGLLNNDGLVVILFVLHVFGESALDCGCHCASGVASISVVVASVKSFTAVVVNLAFNDWVSVQVSWEAFVARVVVSPSSYVLLCLSSSTLVQNGVVLGVKTYGLNACLSTEAVNNAQSCLTQLQLVVS